VTPAPVDDPGDAGAAPPAMPPEDDDDETARINLRLPGQLKAGVERAASREGLSVNAWLVRVVAAAVARDGSGRRPPHRGGRIGEAYTGWVR
jgi:hypothetical protein